MLGALLIGIKQGEWPTDPLTDKAPELPHLLNAFNGREKEQKGKEPQAEDRLGVYDETTCYEFHRLLVATIHTYANTLGALRIAEREVNLCKEAGETMPKNCGDKSEMNGDRSKEHGRELGKDAYKSTIANAGDVGIKPVLASSQEKDLADLIKARDECTERVWKFSLLLWRIASSQILSHHLLVLAKSSWLQMPGTVEKSLRPEHLGLVSGLTSRRHKDGAIPRHQDGDVDEDSARVKYDSDEGGDGDAGEEDEGFDEEFCRILEAFVRDKDMVIVFQSWMRLQIKYWTDLETISLWSRSTANPCQGVKIHLLSMDRAGQASCEMEEWETTLRNLATESPQLSKGLPASSSFDAQSAIDLLKWKVNEYASDPERDNILKAFTPKPETPDQYNPVFYGTVHFQAILASFVTSPERVAINPIELQALMEVLPQFGDNVFINLMHSTEFEFKYGCIVEALLYGLPGAPEHLRGADQVLRCS